MSRTQRLRLFLIAGAGAAAVVVAALMQLPAFGHYRGPYGTILNRVAVPERRATNVVSSVVFDYRGLDTLGEEFILFAAVIGVTFLLRLQREERPPPVEERTDEHLPVGASDAVRVAALVLVGPVLVLGLYVVAHGHLTPGGGFQGGGVLAAAALLVYLSGRPLAIRGLDPPALLDLGEGLGAGGYVVIGLVGMIAGEAFLSNVVPLGRTVGSIVSAGTIPLLNATVGLAVWAGMVFVVYEFLEQTLLIRKR
ncbi:MAG TPA: hydrogen gas-evolving membrane-bound hydrogenase subunit E [Actinomycetota bacterium]|nr:hydrogen gas-evolving membrane-bound hydrogenase subunit E [Actinomycetota bacterium]